MNNTTIHTDVNDCVGLTIAHIVDRGWDNNLLIRFTDDSVLCVQGRTGYEDEATFEIGTGTLSDDQLAGLNFIDAQELARRKAAEQQREQQRRDDRERNEFERLERKYGRK